MLEGVLFIWDAVCVCESGSSAELVLICFMFHTILSDLKCFSY